MEAVALLILLAAALWLAGVGLLMAARPQRFLQLLGMTASTRRINNTEQSLRMLAGLALIGRAEASKLPILFEAGGWFVVVSSVALLVIPLRLHSGYATWWSQRLRPCMVRALGPVSLALGAALAYSAL